MMNTETLILTHLMAFPGQAPEQIAEAIDRSIKTVYSVLPEMILNGEIWRDHYYRYFSSEPEGEVDTKFSRLSHKAYELQDRNNWNRAARVWLEAMHSTSKEGLREKAYNLRKKCITRANALRPLPEPDFPLKSRKRR